MNALIPWVEARLQEKSTWFGMITIVLTLTGTALAPDKAAAIAMVGSTAASMVCIATKAQRPDELTTTTKLTVTTPLEPEPGVAPKL